MAWRVERRTTIHAEVSCSPSFVVAESLDDLRGPTDGEVVLPTRLLRNQSGPFDLSDEKRHRSMLHIVLREARTQEDLAEYIVRDGLVEYWSALELPECVRRAREARFPALASTARPVVARALGPKLELRGDA